MKCSVCGATTNSSGEVGQTTLCPNCADTPKAKDSLQEAIKGFWDGFKEGLNDKSDPKRCVPCPDEACTGIIRANGRCGYCGKDEGGKDEGWEEQSKTKICPFCAEEIKVKAIICRHCKADLKENKPPRPYASNASQRGHQGVTVQDGFNIGCGIAIFIAMFIFIIAVFSGF